MKIIRFKTIGSTNTYALENFCELENFTVVCADEQTAGKGRFDRVWYSGNFKNIYMTFVIKPDKNVNEQLHFSNLTQYLSVATSKVLETYGTKPEIKWPNDVLVNGKKICGILCESNLKQNRIQGVVLGIGVNLNMPENSIKKIDKPATSLNLETGKTIDRKKFLDALIKEFSKNYKPALKEGFSNFKEEYLKRASFLGKTVWLQQRDASEKEECIAQRLDDEGNLVVLDKNCIEKTVFSGDLILQIR